MFGCVYDDVAGLRLRDTVGMSQIMFEVDYPHGDSTWPHSRAIAEKIALSSRAVENELYLLVRGNAIRCYGLDRLESPPGRRSRVERSS